MSFTDIGIEVNAFKNIPLASGGIGNWRSMLRENGGKPGEVVSFTDIGKTVDGFKTIAYKEFGPSEVCNDGVDNDCDGTIDQDGSPCLACPGTGGCECSGGACVAAP